MNCLVCSGRMHPYFSKSFTERHLENVDYCRCEHCGLCLSKTHVEMSPEAFSEVNGDFHGRYHHTDSCPDDLRWKDRLKEQADLIADLYGLGLLDRSKPWLDYACGDGYLSDRLAAGHRLELLKYDRYEPDSQGYLDEKDLVPRGFNLVVTTSVFEHLTRREYFDEINALVSDDGVMGLHTMVKEVVPKDPDWFYLLPVHTTLHTNKSMEILFEQWGYRSSIYHVETRIWFWFKTEPERVEKIVRESNKRPGAPRYVYKKGFVDYWKE